MALRSDLKKVIESWAGWLQSTRQSMIPRNISLSLPEHMALAVIGVRRCGKSYAATTLLPENDGTSLYINFEDPLFVEHNSVSILDEILSVYTEHFQKTPCSLLFDEIHNIEHWERWARKIIDLKKHRLILTGSSAKMLSSELATSLTGRCLSQTLWPLSFPEYLRFRQQHPKNENEYLGSLREYLFWGGFPEATLAASESEKTAMLRQYLTDILFKDVIKRNNVRSTTKLEQLVRYYLTNVSSLHSYNSVHKAFGLNVETAAEYTAFLTEAFLVFEVNRYHPNLKVQARDSKKIYAVDTGLRNANASSPQEDIGKLAENACYLELRRRQKDISYFKEKGEVDFVVTEFAKPTQAIQVCYSNLDDTKTFQRETESLVQCLKATKLREGFILTHSREETLSMNACTIRLVPLYQWLLQ